MPKIRTISVNALAPKNPTFLPDLSSNSLAVRMHTYVYSVDICGLQAYYKCKARWADTLINQTIEAGSLARFTQPNGLGLDLPTRVTKCTPSRLAAHALD